ncbi:glycosyltransferase [Sediminicoccus rosea]|uniref:Glycosyltransferase n=1 Tax=Sediminicoccus rosea TaxID=1225128 RepID=A0ABZ0PCR2_9PROT|nr:glycosyltransferase [Sediminicoccus rosea]WPB83356.1 glycosyltransferase [Sediminicoccus rosea]
MPGASADPSAEVTRLLLRNDELETELNRLRAAAPPPGALGALRWLGDGLVRRARRLAARIARRLGGAALKRLPVPLRALTKLAEPAGSAAEDAQAFFHTISTTRLLKPETGHRPRPPFDAATAPRVSVVIVSFNYGRFVGHAVESVLSQSFQDLEVIVVEGGSTDTASREAVRGLAQDRVRVLFQDTPQPAGANRNFGISQARGHYVCCLDADDTLAPTYIEHALYLIERQGYDVVSCGLRRVGGDAGEYFPLEQPELRDLLEGNQVLTCALFRRALWEASGGFRDIERDAIGHVHEDWLFWVRLAALGARIRNLPRAPYLHYRVHPGSLSNAKDVLPVWQQRVLVQRANMDVLWPLAETSHMAHSAHAGQGTPQRRRRRRAAQSAAALAGRPPTLLLALPWLVLGGAERLLSGVVGHLTASGWRVVVVTTLAADPVLGDSTPWFSAHTREIFDLPRAVPPEFRDDFLLHLIEAKAPDIVWIVGSAAMYGLLPQVQQTQPSVRVADLLFNTVGHVANNARHRHRIDLNLVESQAVRQFLLDSGEAAARIRLIESGVDLDALRPQPKSEGLLARIGARPGQFLVGFMGRWSEEKNPLGFIEIARMVDQALPVTFLMTGTGPMRSEIEAAIARAGFPPGRFLLLGEVPEVAPVLGSLGLLVLPSRLDGRPTVVMEAAAMGVPVLASRVGGLPDLVMEGETGWLCDAADLPGFAARIAAAAADPAALDRMRGQARRHAEQRFDQRAMLTSYAAALAELLPRDHRAHRHG